MSLTVVVDVSMVIAGFAAVGIPFLAWFTKHSHTLTQHTIEDSVRRATQPLQDQIQAIDLKLAAEFGGNSGGMRQAINEQNGTLTKYGEEIARLSGRFEQHMLEEQEKRQ